MLLPSQEASYNMRSIVEKVVWFVVVAVAAVVVVADSVLVVVLLLRLAKLIIRAF